MKKVYAWGKVKRGDIISFIYKSKENRRLRRTILVLEPKLANKSENANSKFLIHGIQLEVSNASVVSSRVITEILTESGVVESVDKDIYRVELKDSSEEIYKRLKSFIKKNGLYRSFSFEKASRSGVFLEDLRLPEKYKKMLLDEN
tara:strand:+ start:751 stop:1188 length:438 start_codon:yes stop_codon:yes gene_type:complete